VVVFIAGAVGMLRCLGMQRVALDLSSWCDCAKSTVTVRILEAREATPSGWEHQEAADDLRDRRSVLRTTLGK
jgi:hypothetical protein